MDWGTDHRNTESTWDSKGADGFGEGVTHSQQDINAKFPENSCDVEQVGGKGDSGCHNCGEKDHYARECPQDRKLTGECFNCGEVGHNKADCTKPRVERPFTGTCRSCGKEGHRSADCPGGAPQLCKNCHGQGHKTAECTKNRVMDLSDIPEMSSGDAWAFLQKASDERDMDDFKLAVRVFSKANPDVTFDQLEVKFRKANFSVYLVAMEKELHKSITLVNLQGKLDCKYAISYQYSAKPKRVKYADGWPSNPVENMERLKDAGVPMEQFIPLCRNCDELGHISKNCPQEKVEVERMEIVCSNCTESGHRMRDCPKPRYDPNQCKNCKQSGHKAADCTEPRSAEGVECRRCNNMGHFASDCPNNPVRSCHNCGDTDHMSKDCDKPRNPENSICKNCDQKGHFSRDCPQPKDWSRVKCSCCGEMGHTIKRCKQAISGENDVEPTTTEDPSSKIVAEGEWMQATDAADDVGW